MVTQSKKELHSEIRQIFKNSSKIPGILQGKQFHKRTSYVSNYQVNFSILSF